MDLHYSHAQAQRFVRQRNMLAIGSLALLGSTVMLALAAASKDSQVILQPILAKPLALSSDNVSKDYLELVTRDTALLTLNRSPENLDFWMDQVLGIADPRAHGKLKAELMRIREEQNGSNVSQYFTPERMSVDAGALTSEIKGILHTVVGQKEVSAEAKTFRYVWTYNGVSLKLAGFGLVKKDDKDGQNSAESAS